MRLSRDRPKGSFRRSKIRFDCRVVARGVVGVRRAPTRPQHGHCVVSKVEVITDSNGRKQTKPTHGSGMHATHTRTYNNILYHGAQRWHRSYADTIPLSVFRYDNRR